MKAFQYKVINSILYTNTKLLKIGHKTDDLCTFCNAEPENLSNLFYDCSHSKNFWIDFESYWCFLSNQQISLSIVKHCPLSNLLNYFIIIGKLFSWDCRRRQTLPKIQGFQSKIKNKFDIERKISKKDLFKKWLLVPIYG